MNNKLKTFLAFALGVVIAYTAPSIASTIKTWSNGSTLTAADLNANFSHIHSTMVGGHGAKLVDADVSSSAEITHSKLSGDVALPDMHLSVLTACTVADAGCTVAFNQGFTAVVDHQATIGNYKVRFDTRSDTVYAVQTTSLQQEVHCGSSGFQTSSYDVNCVRIVGLDGGYGMGGPADALFSTSLTDDN